MSENTHDPDAVAAWASRPTGPLSDLYVTAEQMTAIFAWLGATEARVVERERRLARERVLACESVTPNLIRKDDAADAAGGGE